MAKLIHTHLDLRILVRGGRVADASDYKRLLGNQVVPEHLIEVGRDLFVGPLTVKVLKVEELGDDAVSAVPVPVLVPQGLQRPMPEVLKELRDLVRADPSSISRYCARPVNDCAWLLALDALAWQRTEELDLDRLCKVAIVGPKISQHGAHLPPLSVLAGAWELVRIEYTHGPVLAYKP